MQDQSHTTGQTSGHNPYGATPSGAPLRAPGNPQASHTDNAGITINSTATDVATWLATFEGGVYDERKEGRRIFQGATGAMLFRMSEGAFTNLLGPLWGPSFYGVLHPIITSNEITDTQDERATKRPRLTPLTLPEFLEYFLPRDWRCPDLLLEREVPKEGQVIAIGSYFPFQNRVKSRKTLLDRMKKQYQNWTVRKDTGQDIFRKSYEFSIVPGAPGIGKTTFTRRAIQKEFREIIEGTSYCDTAFSSVVSNCCKGGFVVSLSLASSRPKTEVELVSAIAFNYLNHNMALTHKWSEFMVRFPEGVSLSAFVDGIIQRFSLPTPTMFVLHIDETNSPKDMSYLEELDRKLVEQVFKGEHFIAPVQTGSRALMMQAACKAVSNQVPQDFIGLELLLNDLECVAKHILEGPPSKFMKQLISYCSGNPRFLEYVFVGLSCSNDADALAASFSHTVDIKMLRANNSCTLNESEKSAFLSRIAKIFSHRYREPCGEYFFSKGVDVQKLLAIVLLSKNVLREDGIGLGGSDSPTFGELESEGLIFLQPGSLFQAVPHTLRLRLGYRVSVSFYLLQLISEYYTGYNKPKLLRSTSELLSPRENEFLDLEVLLMKLELLVSFKYEISLSVLFPCYPVQEDITFSLPPSFRFREYRHNCAKLSAEEFEEHVADMLQEGYIGELGPGSDEFPDAFLVLTNAVTNKQHILFIQSKRRREVGAKSVPVDAKTGTMQIEHAKCKSFFANNHTFILVTDDKEGTKEIELQPNEMLMSSNWHKSFYGTSLALRKLDMC